MSIAASTIAAKTTETSSSAVKPAAAASAPVKKSWLLSLDSWAVVAAFAAALLIRGGVLKHIPW